MTDNIQENITQNEKPKIPRTHIIIFYVFMFMASTTAIALIWKIYHPAPKVAVVNLTAIFKQYGLYHAQNPSASGLKPEEMLSAVQLFYDNYAQENNMVILSGEAVLSMAQAQNITFAVKPYLASLGEPVDEWFKK